MEVNGAVNAKFIMALKQIRGLIYHRVILVPGTNNLGVILISNCSCSTSRLNWVGRNEKENVENLKQIVRNLRRLDNDLRWMDQMKQEYERPQNTSRVDVR